MTTDSTPYCFPIDISAGTLADGTFRAWHLAEVAASFQDHPDPGVASRDPCIYTTSMHAGGEEAGDLTFGVTRINPGKIGAEFFMTRGHIHAEPASETYTFLAGTGGVLCRRDAVVVWTAASAGSVVYIPAGWLHRTVNTGVDRLVFLTAVASTAGHDYSLVEAEGMGARVIDTADGPAVTAEPAFVVSPPHRARG